MGFNLQKLNSITTVFAVHGFLGQSSDWNHLKNQLPQNFNFITPNLFGDAQFDLSNFEVLTSQIYKLTSQITSPISLNMNSKMNLPICGQKIFIGYSLGGRIGLHLLEKHPELFDQYIFVSTHPGLESADQKNQRLLSDSDWIQKIKKLSWQNFLSEWNTQPVFAESKEPERSEFEFNKEQLICALTGLSLGNQKNMYDIIRANQKKIKWIVGAKDLKFLDLAEAMKQKKILEDYSKIFCGHRILFEPQFFDFIKSIFLQE